MKLSFGMIFSIILIVVFLFFTFFAVKKFLEIPRSVQIGKFKEGLQEDIDSIWRGSQGYQEVSYNLPKKIEKVYSKEIKD